MNHPLRPLLSLLVASTGLASAALGLEIRNPAERYVLSQGEDMVWDILIDQTAHPQSIRYSLRQEGGTLLQEGILTPTDGTATFRSTATEPGTIFFEVEAAREGHPPLTALAGAVVDPEMIGRSAPRPEDFDAFWEGHLEALGQLPLNPVLTSSPSGAAGVSYWKVTLDHLAGGKIQAQLARPEMGETFPALVVFQYAGVYGLPQTNVTRRAEAGWLTLNVMAHDLPLDESPDFYQEQREGPLRAYVRIGREDRETSYFLRMLLATSRAVDYVASRPDWDGRTLVVIGNSQGGLQAVAAAALNPQVTAAIMNVTAGCDTTAPLAGRRMSWPYWLGQTQGEERERIAQTSSYFDAVNFAPRVTCPVLAAFGLLDRSATASSNYLLVRHLGGPVEPLLLPWAEHQNKGGTHDPFYRRSQEWLDSLVSGVGRPEL